MAKVRTLSRRFLSGHPRAGEPTYFVEKFWKGLRTIGYSHPKYFFEELPNLSKVFNEEQYKKVTPKLHTIREGKHFKEGDYFSPRVWSGAPYNSKQIIIAPDVRIKKTYDIRIYRQGLLNWLFYIDGRLLSSSEVSVLAANDGLSHIDFLHWFNIPVESTMEGQIICWAEVDYNL